MLAVGYFWASPASALGAILGALGLAGGGRMSIHSGVLEVEGRLLAWGLKHLTVLDGGADAITFGHVVLARDAVTLAATRSHERVHVRQYERWGPLFIPLYLAASAWALASGRDPYRDNPFEREARDLEDGPDASRPEGDPTPARGTARAGRSHTRAGAASSATGRPRQ